MRLSTGERVFSTTRVICTGHGTISGTAPAALRTPFRGLTTSKEWLK